MDSKDIKKHRSDVLRLLQVVRAEPLDTVPHVVRSDTARCAVMIREESPAVHNLRLVFGIPEEALGLLEVLYGTRPTSRSANRARKWSPNAWRKEVASE